MLPPSQVVTARRCPEVGPYLCGDITNAAQTSAPSVGSAVLSGSLGSAAAPVVALFRASDPDRGDLVFSVGDSLDIVFDRPTNQAHYRAISH